MTALPLCADQARACADDPVGTAPIIRSVLLVEHPGPWSPTAVADVLADALGPVAHAAVRELVAEHQLRPLLIRRPGRAPAPTVPTVLVGCVGEDDRWLERVPVEGYGDLRALDLERVATGGRGLGEPVAAPQFLVCTHGRKDACCAVHGRPVATALAARDPTNTWQSSHYGGDRFAGSLLALPYGLMYGWLDPATALEVAEALRAGSVPVAHLRGRTAVTFLAQYAEVVVRTRTGLTGVDDVRTVEHRIDGTDAVVRVRAGPSSQQAQEYEVHLRRRPTDRTGATRCDRTVTAAITDVSVRAVP